jgi:hypothetical protein
MSPNPTMWSNEGAGVPNEATGVLAERDGRPFRAVECPRGARMRRRVVMTLGSAAAVATPKWAAAQEGRRLRLAVIDSYEAVAQMAATGSNRMYGSFFRELRRLGRIEGTNLTIERWSANGESASVFTVARDVVASRPDAIFAGDVFSGRALRTWTSDIPVVLAGGSFHAWGGSKACRDPAAT